METDANTFYGGAPRWLAAIRVHPQVRKGVKIALDAGIAAGSLAAVGLILHQGLPSLRSGSTYLVLAMAVNLGFRFCTQHYRVASLAEAGSIFLGNVVLVAAAMGLCAMHRTRWPSLDPPDVVLGACLLTGPLWFGLRLALRGRPGNGTGTSPPCPKAAGPSAPSSSAPAAPGRSCARNCGNTRGIPGTWWASWTTPWRSRGCGSRGSRCWAPPGCCRSS